MPKPTSAASSPARGAGVVASPAVLRVVLVTMDNHLSSAAQRAHHALARSMPGLTFSIHAAAQWSADADALERCRKAIGEADIVIATMLFMEDHFLPVLDALQARRDHCDAMVCAMSAAEVTRLTRMGRFDMSAPQGGLVGLLRRLRGKPQAEGNESSVKASAGEKQMRMLRRLPKLLRFIPGTAQDVRAYFLTLQYWLAGSEGNLVNLVTMLVERYAQGPRKAIAARAHALAPMEYPEVGLYHPRLGAQPIVERTRDLPRVARSGAQGTVGLLLMRSYLLAGNGGHYDGVITALEARGLRVIPAFATGLDSRPAIEKYFLEAGRSTVDALVSLTGFPLVGGPAYNDARAAEEILARLDVPYLAVTPVEFQSIDQWATSERGLMPIESTMMVAMPELDGATGPMVFGGRGGANGQTCHGCARGCTFDSATGEHDMQTCSERADALAARVLRLVQLRRRERAERRVGIVLFNFPPNAGNTGTAAFLSVFESLWNTLAAMQREGYTVELPASVDALREAIITGNASRFGAQANVHARIAADDHVRRERHLREIESQWGPAPGRQQSDGASIFVLGAQFGHIFVGVQPAFGFEGDPMRLLFEKGFAPTHAFSAFYRWLREDFKADALLHFGTHGALEFMPGKQSGLSSSCWPDRLIGELPNIYLYASNNPSEGTLAKRRAAATLVSYLTPPVAQAGLYRDLVELKGSLDRYRSLDPQAVSEARELATMIQAQAAALELASPEPAWGAEAGPQITRLTGRLLELEYTLIPYGLHVVGKAPSDPERLGLLAALAQASHDVQVPAPVLQAMLQGESPAQALRLWPAAEQPKTPDALTLLTELAQASQILAEDHELEGLMRALDARYLSPAPGGDLLRTPAILPTGRNLHGFDPFRMPSRYAVADGARQAQRLLDRHLADGHGFPESIAMVLWGTDNLKTEGGPIAQALALMGATPRFDSYGRLAGAQLLPLAQLGRPRIDVVITLSGVFRDLLPLQIKLLAEAAYLAASATDESPEDNFIRKHALAYQAKHGGDLETASLRVFGNAEGAYGSNVNNLIDSSRWDDADEIAETYTRRKGFAYGRTGRAVAQTQLLQSVLSGVELSYQSLDSVELGVTTIDTYFDTLGGISRAISRARGPSAEAAPVYIGDQTQGGPGEGTVRTLTEQVCLETRSRMLNPKWYEGMLQHGYEGVRQIEVHLTNTMGWSATTGQVAPWVYQKLSETFVLDPEMRERMARLNPTASARMANRLIEASDRKFWSPEPAVLDALRQAGEELEDRVEGVVDGVYTPTLEGTTA